MLCTCVLLSCLILAVAQAQLQRVLSSPTEVTVTEGNVPFVAPDAGAECFTHYKVYGHLDSGIRPLVALHGGPGVPSDYLEPLTDFARLHGIPLVMYDQLGNGLSTHLPHMMGNTTFWTPQLFLDELDNLLLALGIHEDYNLLGHSWGGMLASMHAITQPVGLRKLVISSSPASMPLWVKAQAVLRAQLPQDVQDVLNEHEENGTTDSPEYEEAVQVFYSQFLCRVYPPPEPLQKAFEWLAEDNTVYLTMNGPNEFFITGSLQNWSVVDDIHKISVTTLLTNGKYDEAQNSVVEPFAKKIQNVEWVTFEESSHTAFFEQRDEYIGTIARFLKKA